MVFSCFRFGAPPQRRAPRSEAHLPASPRPPAAGHSASPSPRRRRWRGAGPPKLPLGSFNMRLVVVVFKWCSFKNPKHRVPSKKKTKTLRMRQPTWHQLPFPFALKNQNLKSQTNPNHQGLAETCPKHTPVIDSLSSWGKINNMEMEVRSTLL